MRGDDARQYVHALSGGGAFLLYYLPAGLVAALVAGGALFAAVVGLRRIGGRLKPLPGPLHRPHETPFRSGATTYAVGVIVALLLFPKESAFVGWLGFAAGDSASTLAGTRWPLKRLGTKRSLGGTMAFALAAGLVGAGGLWWWHGELHTAAVGAVVVSAVVGAVAEAIFPQVDDNLFLPAVMAMAYQVAQG